MFKFLARKILRKEIEKQKQKALCMEKKYQELFAYKKGKRFQLLSNDLLRAMIDMLPDAGCIARGEVSVENLKNEKRGIEQVIAGSKRKVLIYFVATDDEEKQSGLTLFVTEYNMKVFFPLVKQEFSAVKSGIGASVTVWIWDIYDAGIRLVSDSDLESITSFLATVKKVPSLIRRK